MYIIIKDQFIKVGSFTSYQFYRLKIFMFIHLLFHINNNNNNFFRGKGIYRKSFIKIIDSSTQHYTQFQNDMSDSSQQQ